MKKLNKLFAFLLCSVNLAILCNPAEELPAPTLNEEMSQLNKEEYVVIYRQYNSKSEDLNDFLERNALFNMVYHFAIGYVGYNVGPHLPISRVLKAIKVNQEVHETVLRGIGVASVNLVDIAWRKRISPWNRLVGSLMGSCLGMLSSSKKLNSSK